MVWCKFCAKNCPPVRLEDSFICCGTCGKVVEYDNFSSEPTFVKNAAGQSQLSGNFVRTVQSTISASRERTLNRARTDMDFMVTTLGMSGGDSLVNQGLALYTIALERNFTKGRRAEQVEAACLYIACRENKKPFLLIDFSDYLKINVYVLGAVFLQLCQLLSLEEHPIVQKPVDPSLFIHRFTAGLPGGTNMVVSRTALRIISSMKRDWMQTGRKPSGLCGAALFISALSHGLTCSKLDIIKIVHVCEVTLTKRLLEFEDTESGGLTLEEFNLRAEELEKLSTKEAYTGSTQSAICELLCEHKGSSRPSFAHGLCEECYDDFITISGGLDGGSDPPAFQQAERERMAQASLEEIPCLKEKQNLLNNSFAKKHDMLNTSSTEQVDRTEPNGPDKIDLPGQRSSDESEGISDIDDIEIDSYLHNEEEKHFKKIIWEELNKEYVQEQAAKEAAAAAAKEALQASFSGTAEEFEAAQELAAAAAAAVAKSRKEKQQKRAAEAKNIAPARTAAEATRQMLTKKRLSSKINYDVLEKLFEEPDVSENPKKSRTEFSEDDKHTTMLNGSKDSNLEESYNVKEPGLADEWGDDAYAKEGYQSDDYEDYGYCDMEDEYSTY